jgi:polyisoprenoid-binding protein YceI
MIFRRTKGRFRLLRARFFYAFLLLAATAALAQDVTVQLDPAQSHIDFSLEAVSHTVHGSFHLKTSTLRFDPQNGSASGQLAADATSGASGNNGRDRKMHQQVLESAKYPDIIFEPQHVVGHLPANGSAAMEIAGLLTMHGQTHPITASGPVQVNGDAVTADLKMTVPYQEWGMKNPSALFLRVNKEVEITVHAVGSFSHPANAAAAQAVSHR